MIETLTIVLALGVTRGWRAPLQGAVAALAVLVVLVAVLGPALDAVPIDLLRLVVGSLLLVFGLQWLRKAILRASGWRALHDEDETFAAEVAAAQSAGKPTSGMDHYALVISFKSTLLEGLEVAFIVITLGANQGATGIAATGAVAAFVVVRPCCGHRSFRGGGQRASGPSSRAERPRAPPQNRDRFTDTVSMSESADEDWLRPIDLMVDSYAPEEITFELGRRHGLYLREAQRLVVDGLAPDEAGLAEGIRDATRRYRTAGPWADRADLDPAFDAAEGAALAALGRIARSARPPAPAPAPSAKPVRRLTLQPAATIIGNMTVRKRQVEDGLELAWDAAANVEEWKVRVSSRPDPRRDYVEGELIELPAGATSFVAALDEHPRRIQLYGHARDGRVVRRAVISALTSGNSGAQWKRQATAS